MFRRVLRKEGERNGETKPDDNSSLLSSIAISPLSSSPILSSSSPIATSSSSPPPFPPSTSSSTFISFKPTSLAFFVALPSLAAPSSPSPRVQSEAKEGLRLFLGESKSSGVKEKTFYLVKERVMFWINILCGGTRKFLQYFSNITSFERTAAWLKYSFSNS